MLNLAFLLFYVTEKEMIEQRFYFMRSVTS